METFELKRERAAAFYNNGPGGVKGLFAVKVNFSAGQKAFSAFLYLFSLWRLSLSLYMLNAANSEAVLAH